MKINQEEYDPDNTYALMNAIGPEAILRAYDPLLEGVETGKGAFSPLRALASTKYRRGSTLDAFKRAFGRQQTTQNYSYRNWIWTFTSDDGSATMHCLVNSHQGLSWEYNRATSDVDSLEPLMNEIVQALLKEVTN